MRTPRLIAIALAAVLAPGACSSDSYVIVTVDARPAVRDPRALSVSLSNAGTTRVDTLALAGHAFPVTFSISAPGRAGDLAISVDATDDAGLVVGRGSAQATLASPEASVLLETADFVVNTEFAADQFPADDFEAAGFQLAALPDGTWTAAYRDSCQANSCNIYGRRFDKLGKPVQTAVSASANAFLLSTQPTLGASTPAIAAGATTTLAVWDFYDLQNTTHGLACRSLDPTGRATADQTLVATDSADVVAVAALGTGSFVASWNAQSGSDEVIRTATIRPDCIGQVAAQTVSTSAGFAHRASLAASGDRVLFAWILDGNLYTRMAQASGALLGLDGVLVPLTATEQIAHARVAAASGGGFVIAARWVQSSLTSGPGRIELFRVSAAGQIMGAPTLVTDRSATDVDNRESFGIASRPDGTVLVAWHTCDPIGDDSRCGVFGRFLRDTGEPLGDAFVIPTTTDGDQKRPSVVALPDGFVAMWSDGSARPPDTVGLSVRARILYPPAR